MNTGILKAVIFDFDGVIVDTEPLHYRAFQVILEPLGLGYSWEQYASHYMGFDDRDAFKEAFRAGGKNLLQSDLDELVNKKAALFQDVVAKGVNAYPGVIELIKSLSSEFPIAICSGALLTDIQPILLQLGVDKFFSAIVSADEVPVSKPDPASYRRAVEKLAAIYPSAEIVPSSCVAIEDTPAGIASACAAGIRVIAVTNSYPAEVLVNAARIVPSLDDISISDLISTVN